MGIFEYNEEVAIKKEKRRESIILKCPYCKKEITEELLISKTLSNHTLRGCPYCKCVLGIRSK